MWADKRGLLRTGEGEIGVFILAIVSMAVLSLTPVKDLPPYERLAVGAGILVVVTLVLLGVAWWFHHRSGTPTP